ncbi:DMT family transporter [Microbacterium yannicii]|uniref:DMT family transporter n=1 Tax=Microbacterium yannicii TaxID=671622 RepID=UPI00036FD70D|nr:DMT family transporter [Microbacterium yannicii]
MIAITALWGGTFLVVQIAVSYSGPWFFVGLRFLVAGLISAVIFHRALRRMTRADLLAGAAIGVTIYLGYGLQTVGLQTIESSMSAFITAFYVPLVPLLQWIVLRKPPGALTLVGVALAFVGLVLVAGPSAEGVVLGEGELLTILSTVAIAAEIVLISLFAGKVDLVRVTVVQLLVASLLAFGTMPAVGEALPAFSWVWLACGVGLGAASCLIQLTMNWAQRSVSPTRATVIYAAEPVWAGIIGRIAGERLGPLALLGAAFIIAGMLVSEIKPRRQKQTSEPTAEPTASR